MAIIERAIRLTVNLHNTQLTVKDIDNKLTIEGDHQNKLTVTPQNNKITLNKEDNKLTIDERYCIHEPS